MESLWTMNSKRPQFPTQARDMKTEILIIGGGLSGILCAYLLESAGADYILVEADRICGGITKNTTAKLTVQHGLIYDKLIRTFGLDGARMYMGANHAALERYRRLCRTVDCDFEEKDAFVYSVNDRAKIEAEVEAYEKIGASAEFVTDLPLPFAVSGAVMVSRQAQFDPLKFAYTVAKDLRIMECTKVLELRGDHALTNRGKIKADKIIVATHFPFINKHGGYFLKMYQHRSYVLALENAPDVNGMYLDEAETGLSFRNHGDLLLIGGGSHRTGKNSGGWKELSHFALKNYPSATEVARWATQDCMSLDCVPYIGRYSKRTPNMYVATGFNKWGMTSAMAAAMILTDMVRGKDNPYEELFCPSRSSLHLGLVSNAAHSLLGLLTPTVPRCPHLGCALKYNKQEHSWDCPCHGSRFTKEGQLVDNPSVDDMKR